MADLSAITGTVGDELKELEQTARRVGVNSGLGASESARAFTILASQIDLPIEQLKQLQEQSILLAQAGAIPLERAAGALAGTINQFGVGAEESTRIVNVLAAASRAGGAEVNDLADSFKTVGATAASAGLSIEETSAILEVLAMNDMKGAEAGTAMRNALISMQTVLGIDLEKTGFVGGLKAIKAHVESISDPIERSTFMTKAFGRENITAAQFLLENADAVETMTEQVTNTNAATEQAEIRNNTWAHSLQLLKAKMEDLQISLVDLTGGTLPFFAGLAEQLVPLAQLSPLINTMSNSFSSLFKIVSNSPFGKWALIIGAVAGAVTVLYQNSEEFRAFCDDLWKTVQDVAKEFMEALKPALDNVLQTIKSILPTVQNLIQLLAQHLASILKQLAPIFTNLVKAIAPIIPIVVEVIGVFMKIVGTIIEALTPAIEGIMSIIEAVLPYLLKWHKFWTEFFVKVIETAVGWIKSAIEWVKELFGIVDSSPESFFDESKINKETEAIDKQKDALKELEQRRANLLVRKDAESRLGGSTTFIDDQIRLVDQKIAEEKKRREALDTLSNEVNKPSPTSTSEVGELHLNGKLKQKEGKEQKIINETSLEGLQNKIAEIQEKAAKATFKDAVELEKSAQQLQKKLELEKQIIDVQIKHGAEKGEEARRILSSEDVLQKELFIAQYIKDQKVDLESIEGLNTQIAAHQKALATATEEQAVEMKRALLALQEEKRIKEELLEIEAKYGKSVRKQAEPILRSGSKEDKENFKKFIELDLSPAPGFEGAIDNAIRLLDFALSTSDKKKEEQFKRDQKRRDDEVKAERDKMRNLQGTMGAISDIMGSVGDAIGGSAGEWLDWGANAINAISQALPQLAKLFSANLAVTATEAGKSQAGIPFVGPAMAIASIASIIATLMNVPKATPFAEGGIVSGTTFAMVGEYAGASNNPEVIAPLDKLRTLIEPRGEDSPAQVVFKIGSRELVAILNKEAKIRKY